jgi:MMP 1-O-methyltransferase
VVGVIRSLGDRIRRDKQQRDPFGSPDGFAGSLLGLVPDLMRWGRLGQYIWRSRRIPGWGRGAGAIELAKISEQLEGAPVIVEIGSFLGCSAVLLAGARKVKRSGCVHCVDPFAATGDAFSVPVYQKIADTLGMSIRQRFERNIRSAGLRDFVIIHQMTSADAARQWTDPIDLLYLDGDQSPEGAREAYLSWSPFLRSNAVFAINASADGPNEPGHDGLIRVIKEFVHLPGYEDIRCIDGITFAKTSPAAST